MVHPELAAADPYYWPAMAVLAASPLLLWMARSRSPVWVRALAIVLLVFLTLPSACYGLLGTACYVGGDCL